MAENESTDVRHKTGLRALWAPTFQFYALGEIFKVFSITLVTLSGIFLMTTTLQFLHKGIGLLQFTGKMPFVVLYFLPFIMPVAMLAGITLGLGRLIQDREITALRSAGVAYVQIAAPVLAAAFLLSYAMVHLQQIIIPACYKQMREVENEYTREILSLSRGENKSIRGDRMFLHLGKYDGGYVEDITFWQVRKNNVLEIYADRGIMSFTPEGNAVVLDLENVSFVHLKPQFQTGTSGHFRHIIPLGKQTRIPAKGLDNADLRREIHVMKEERDEKKSNMRMIKEKMQKNLPDSEMKFLQKEYGGEKSRFRKLEKELAEHRTELYRRTPFAYATLAFALMALPIALLLNHKNRLVPFFVAFIVCLFVCFIPMSAAIHLATAGKIGPHMALWYGNIASLLLGGTLLWRLFGR